MKFSKTRKVPSPMTCLSAIVLTAFSSVELLSAGQSPEALSQFFEGKMVTVKIDMPGSQKGIDIYPDKTPSLDTKNYSKRMRDFPASLRSGDTVLISKVRAKSDNIEFQLGGGGFGTALDNTDTSSHFKPAEKSSHEKELEDQLSKETDPDRRRSLSSELDDVRRDRERQDRREKAAASESADERKQQVSSNRARGGSRFNIHLGKSAGNEVPTPQVIMSALAQYVYFPADAFGHDESQPAQTASSPASAVPPPQNSAPQPMELKKGLTKAQVEALFGPPIESHDDTQDGLTKTTCTYQNAKEILKAEFVSGVLVQYSTTSR